MNRFVFKSYDFDRKDLVASFRYGFENGVDFVETARFDRSLIYDEKILDKALFLAFVIIGISYYKIFPSTEVMINYPIDSVQASFFNKVYQEGLSQFAFENGMTRDDLAHFSPSVDFVETAIDYDGSGTLSLQSGGKDSLLTATLLQNSGCQFFSFFVTNSEGYPNILNSIGQDLVTCRRKIDTEKLKLTAHPGAMNGHVPITYINQSLAIIQAILMGKNTILTSIAHEGEELHSRIGDLAVNHQWSKTWDAEILFANYVNRYISPGIMIGSPLRRYSELRVAELFVKNCWAKYGQRFSSCNQANYKIGADNTSLKWCGKCPKCVNSYLLFAPFVKADELDRIFKVRGMFDDPNLQQIFKGLLGVEAEMKPFECVGEIDELRLAYHMAQSTGQYPELSFSVHKSSFDYMKLYPMQNWLNEVLQ